jgi:hypothetical protein
MSPGHHRQHRWQRRQATHAWSQDFSGALCHLGLQLLADGTATGLGMWVSVFADGDYLIKAWPRRPGTA